MGEQMNRISGLLAGVLLAMAGENVIAADLPDYEIIPWSRVKVTQQSTEYYAVKVDRVRHRLALCEYIMNQNNPRVAGCYYTKEKGLVADPAQASVRVAPLSTPAGTTIDVWLIDIKTGAVKICFNLSVDCVSLQDVLQ
jgi:hypothetical protein